MTDEPSLKLGLIGDNIARSRSPLLHRLAGRQNGMAVQYDRLIPKDMGEDFDTVFGMCVARGYRGINVTYPTRNAPHGWSTSPIRWSGRSARSTPCSSSRTDQRAAIPTTPASSPPTGVRAVTHRRAPAA
jgi:hypothetical protein